MQANVQRSQIPALQPAACLYHRGCSWTAVIAGEIVTIGRSEYADICIRWDISMSRRHATISYDAREQVFKIEDNKSTNGTLVNGKSFVGAVRLRDGDKIRMGRTELVFSIKKFRMC